MTLTLEITNLDRSHQDVVAQKTFCGQGGTIGKLIQNDWCLPNPRVSRQHAVIHFREGAYSLEDRSLNGVFNRTRGQWLTKGQSEPLADGDILLIEPYEVRVHLSQEVRSQGRVDSPSDADVPFEDLVDPDVRAWGQSDRRAGDVRGIIGSSDLESELMDLPAESGAPVASTFDLHIPEDWERPHPEPVHVLGPSDSRTGMREVPPKPSTTVARIDGLPSLADVLREAGLDSSEVSAELARDFGRILNIVVTGLMEVLRARQRVKEAFRVDHTAYRPRDNNPLKFSVDAADALHNLLVKHHPGYLAAVPAFQDAFNDVRDHEVAVLAGMRAAFNSMLQRFDPTALQSEFDRQIKGGAFVAVTARSRYWSLYQEKYRSMAKDPDTGFRTLFGDAFARAYDEQLQRLKARRGRGSAPRR